MCHTWQKQHVDYGPTAQVKTRMSSVRHIQTFRFAISVKLDLRRGEKGLPVS